MYVNVRSRAIASLLALFICLSFIGCGSGGGFTGGQPGGGGQNPGGGQSGGTVTFESRKATFRAAEAKRLEWDGLPKDTRNQQMAAFLKAQSGIAETGISADGSVWARFTDDRYYVMNETLFPEKSGIRSTTQTPSINRPAAKTRRAVANASASASGRGSRASGSVELPKTTRAYLLTGILDTISGVTFPLESPPNGDLQTILEDHGYTVIRHDADVDFLKTVGQASILHFSTHGGIGGSAQQGNTFYSVYTSTQVSPENDIKYHDDLSKGRLVYFSAPIGYTANVVMKEETHYAITEKFVRDYSWSFTPNSIAFMNCCWSDSSGFNAALRSLPQPCSATLGWSNAAHPQKAWDAARFFFDRLLGANALAPKETVKQRAFDLAAVYGDAAKRGITDASTSSYGATNLVAADTGGPGGTVNLTRNYILAPSIERMDVEERSLENPTLGESLLTIHGMFGSEQGSVTIDDEPVVAIKSWAADKIVCKIADKPGPGFSGNVIVASKTGIEGNAVPLSQWQGKFTYQGKPFSIAQPMVTVLDMNVVFRADVHEYRTEPGGTMKQQTARMWRAAAGSTSHWESQNGPLPGFSWVKYQDDMPYGMHGSAFPQYGKYGTGFVLEGTLNPSTGLVEITLDFLGCTGTMHPNFPGTPDEDVAMPRDLKILGTILGGGQGGTNYKSNVQGSINANYVIAAGNATGMMTGTHDTRFNWPTLSPGHAPDKREGEDQR